MRTEKEIGRDKRTEEARDKHGKKEKDTENNCVERDWDKGGLIRKILLEHYECLCA